MAALLILIAAASRLPARFLLKRMLLLEPLVIGVAVLMLLQPGGRAVFAMVLLKTNLCLLATVLLSNTTPFTEMLRVLKRLRVPWMFVTTLTLMHRYLFVLADEAERMRRARACRTFTRGRRFEWGVAGNGARAAFHPRVGTGGTHLRRHVRARLEMRTFLKQPQKGTRGAKSVNLAGAVWRKNHSPKA